MKYRKAHKELWKAIKRGDIKIKFGRFGKEKPISTIICLNCNKKIEKNNPTQKYCKKCTISLDTRHLGKKRFNNDK